MVDCVKWEECRPRINLDLLIFQRRTKESREAYRKERMANFANKYLENVPGRYYVDDQCIDCDQCRETAPRNFSRDDASGHSFVFRQPETREEEAQCQEAMQNCPVEAIGDDGNWSARLNRGLQHEQR
jgi:ferredoxin